MKSNNTFRTITYI